MGWRDLDLFRAWMLGRQWTADMMSNIVEVPKVLR